MLLQAMFPTGGENQNPYRIFFPIGIFGILYGMTRMLLPFSPDNVYWHREAMIGLFLVPISVGFLFTAGPRFFASYPAKNMEVGFMFSSFLFVIVMSLFNLRLLYSVGMVVLLFQLVLFVSRRYFSRRSGNPIFASFIFLGPTSGFLGNVAGLISFFTPDPVWGELHKSLYLHGMFWILFFGVGVKFFPMLTLSTRSLTKEPSKYVQIVSKSHQLWGVVGLLLLVSFVVEGLGFVQPAMWARAFIVLFMAREGWMLFHHSPRKGVFTFFLKLALWTVVVSHFVFPFFPELRAHLYHAVFTGGFLMGTLIVMGRVSLSHERLSLEVEVRSTPARIGFTLIYIAMLIRITVSPVLVALPDFSTIREWVPDYVTQLHIAASVVLLGELLLVGLFIYLYKVGKGKGMTLNRQVQQRQQQRVGQQNH